jgi:hypothetical protein
MRVADHTLRTVRISQRGPRPVSPSRWTGRPAALVVAGTLLMAATALVGRRWTGSLVQPPELLAFIMVAGALAASTAAARWLWLADSTPGSTSRATAGFNLLLTIGLASLAGAISLPGSAIAGLWILWLVVIGAEVGGWWLTDPQGRLTRKTESQPKRAAPQPADCGGGPPPRCTDLDGLALVRDESVRLQLVRRRDAAGLDELRGWAMVELAAGQRTAMLHVAFCPTFTATPAIQARQASGPTARVKAAQILPWGARIEVKLSEAVQSPCAARIEFQATCPPPTQPPG